MNTINIHEAKTHLSRLVEEVAGGAEIIIAKNGIPRARLVPVDGIQTIRFGALEGRLHVPDDFDAPLPEAVLELFTGRDAG